MFLDDVNRRRITLYIFLSFQTLKLALFVQQYQLDTLQDPKTGFQLLLLCSLIDTIFFLGLRVARVPWLTFSIFGTLLLVISSWLLNASVVALVTGQTIEQPVADDAPPIYSETDKILDSSHILGSHTVHVRPPTLAKFNPNASAFCLQDLEPTQLYIPLLIRGEPPFYVDYVRYHSQGIQELLNVSISEKDLIRLDTNQKHHPAYTADKELKRTSLYGIRIQEKGLYELKEIRESNGDTGKIVNSKLAQVVDCPSAEWLWIDESSRSASGRQFDLCVDERFYAAVQVTGVAPLSVLYVTKLGNHELVHVGQTEDTEACDLHDLDCLRSKLQPETLQIPVSFKIDSPSNNLLRIARITDGLNNTIEFHNEQTLPPSEQGFVLKTKKDGDLFAVKGHDNPTVKFGNCDNVKIKTLYDKDFEQTPQTSIPVIFNGAPSFQADFEFVSEDHEIEQLHYDIQSHSFSLLATRPGRYSIKSFKDKYCQGIVLQPDQCTVNAVSPPSISVSSTPIEEACLGAVGANVDLSFAGEPPFWIEYQVQVFDLESERLVSSTNERRTQLKPRSSLRFEPELPGLYKYHFTRMGDHNYQHGVSIDVPSLTQIVHPHSYAHFAIAQHQRAHLVRCIGDPVDLQVLVHGSGPWRIVYEIVNGSRGKKYTKDVLAHETSVNVQIETERGGIYIVDLVEITDGNGCTRQLDSQDVTIEVLGSRPSVSFQSLKPLAALENGKAQSLLFLNGRAPFELGYINQQAPQQIIYKQFHSSSGSIDLPIGDYELVSFKDSVCQGRVGKQNKVSVKTVPKPSASILPIQDAKVIKDTIQFQPTCSDAVVYVPLELKGKAPFKITYEHEYHGKKQLVLESNTKIARIPIETLPGMHRYRILSLSDENYKSSISLDLPTIEQFVSFSPSARFSEPEEKTVKCMSMQSGFALKMQLAGELPFELTIESKLDNVHLEYLKLNLDISDLKKTDDGYEYVLKPKLAQAMGKYAYSILSFKDASSCEAVIPQESMSTSIEITDQARISSLNPSDVCVGDMMTFNMQGTPPFTIGYTWKGKQEKIEVIDPVLSFWAGEMGELVINKVCNALQCCDNHVDLRTTVRGLPKVIVDGGQDLVDDIREGDQSEFVVELQGQPPFSFTYSRTNPSEKGKQELYHVENVMDHRWSTVTSQNGIFRVTTIHDKYCGYPRRIQSTSGANVILKK
ncbi:hypothetical protein EDD86DRAFT_204447 [Gorgonomyces haynaldii]|nr:hypothetical protein EDD86DRAFT_204447 [Gorgonomyces haynaldii]